ncbi:MAG TPA: hypothetical protein VFW96_29630 [Thermomicrobiales bacterium]|nr:hypothetical protein [Thermomicrobiales bacterium]
MGEIVTLELPEPLVRNARAVAQQTHRSVEAVLLEWLDRAATEVPLEALPDDQILAIRDQQLTDEQQAALSDLLARQREGLLTDAERVRLDDLLDLYGRGLVRKAQALKIAVNRGLQPPLRDRTQDSGLRTQ